MNLKQEIIRISKKFDLTHVGSNLTAIDIIQHIYSIKKNSEPFILSAGHAHLAHLLVMNKKNTEKLINKYGIHCDRRAGCDVSTGSLGHGLPIAVGMALADRSRNVFCLITDGECSEGSVSESLRIAKEQNLKNLKIYINANGFGGYKKINFNQLKKQIAGFSFPVKLIKTNVADYPAYKGLKGHYVKA